MWKFCSLWTNVEEVKKFGGCMMEFVGEWWRRFANGFGTRGWGGVGKVFGMFAIIVVIPRRELVVLQMVIIIILQLAKIGVYNIHCLFQVWSFFLFWWEAIMGGLPSPSSFEAPSFCIMISSCTFPTTKDFAPNYCQASLGIYGILHCALSCRVQLEILRGFCKKM